jgi:hypothetical protein
VTQLTNYGPQPTQAILINAKAKPSASTVRAAESTKATDSPSETNPNITPTPSAQTQSGLSTAAKAGIGAGIGAGIMIALLVAILVLLARVRKRRADTQLQLQRPGPHPYSLSQPYSTGGSSIGATPKPTSPYYFPQIPAQTEEEKEAWQAAYPPGSPPPPMMSPHYDPNYDPTMATSFHPSMQFSSHVVPSLYSADQRSQQGNNHPPPGSPLLTELSADRHVHELHSEGAVSKKDDKDDDFSADRK